jgi:signal transduction histidine kinase
MISSEPGQLARVELADSSESACGATPRTAGAAVSPPRVSSSLAPELRRLLQRLATIGDGVVEAELIARRLSALLVPDLADLCVVELEHADGIRQFATCHRGAFPPAAATLTERGARIVVEGLSSANGDGHSRRPRLQPGTAATPLRFSGSGDGTGSHHVRAPFGTAIFAPLAIGDDLFGSLSLFRAPDQPRFTESDVDLAELAATLGAAALRRASARIGQASGSGGITSTPGGTPSRPDPGGHSEASMRVAEMHDELERMAQLSTIYSGLGHDLGNLLLPLRLRLESLRRVALPPEGEADLAAIESAVGYLQQLATGLRWLATGRSAASDTATTTRLRSCLTGVQPLLRDALPAHSSLTIDIPSRLPPIRMSGPALTQAVFNLVQNAGRALRGRCDGHVLVAARLQRDQQIVRISVHDNGPGLDEEAKRRCFEPFYSSKKCGLSTGLGLAIVRALMQRVGGDVSVDSEAGAGATFTLAIPVAGSRRARAIPRPEMIVAANEEAPNHPRVASISSADDDAS